MTVIPFQPARPSSGWRTAELRALADACGSAVARGEASGWEVGVTEAGDPQLYLLGAPPDRDCLLCISRLGGGYVLEDGRGNILSEHHAIGVLCGRVQAALRRGKAAVFGRLAVAWAGIRGLIEEEVEPLMAEPLELMSHMAPQLSAVI